MFLALVLRLLASGMLFYGLSDHPYVSSALMRILVCGVAFLLWTFVIDRLPAGVAGLGTLAVPVIGMTGSRLQLGEQIGFWEGWGIALVVAVSAGPPAGGLYLKPPSSGGLCEGVMTTPSASPLVRPRL